MGGLVIDIYIEYIFREIAFLARILRSYSWPVIKATVTGSRECGGYGCDVAEVYYTYRFDGEHYAGVYKKPFILANAAGYYARNSVPKGAELVVRLKPGAPSISVVNWHAN
jgi:hypothetical protein